MLSWVVARKKMQKDGKKKMLWKTRKRRFACYCCFWWWSCCNWVFWSSPLSAMKSTPYYLILVAFYVLFLFFTLGFVDKRAKISLRNSIRLMKRDRDREKRSYIIEERKNYIRHLSFNPISSGLTTPKVLIHLTQAYTNELEDLERWITTTTIYRHHNHNHNNNHKKKSKWNRF